jgi:hypothetical protein
MTEADIHAEIMMSLGHGQTRIFRNHVAKGWTGEFVRSEAVYTVLKNARRASFGLCVGSSDMIGFKKTLITPDMVGNNVAVFTAIEAKAKAGRTSAEQNAFLRVVQQAGGLAGVARSVEEAQAIINRLI